MSKPMRLGGRKHEVEDKGTCKHEHLSSAVVSTEYRDGSLSVVSVVGCDDCNASWTATDYDAVRTH